MKRMTIRAGGEIPVLARDGDLVGWYSQAEVGAQLDRVAGWLRGISPAAGSLMLMEAVLVEGAPLIGVKARVTRRTIYIDPATGSPSRSAHISTTLSPRRSPSSGQNSAVR